MIEYALRAISTLNVASTTVVVGCGAEQVQTAVRGWLLSLPLTAVVATVPIKQKDALRRPDAWLP